MAQKIYEQYFIGEVFESYGRTITEADIVNFTCFAGLKLPMFIDEEFSKKHSLYKTRVAPGLMTASIGAGMLEDILGKYTLAALGLDRFKFTAPVKIGDTLHARITVEGTAPLVETRNPGIGQVVTMLTASEPLSAGGMSMTSGPDSFVLTNVMK
mgnify:CR=1 FL=1